MRINKYDTLGEANQALEELSKKAVDLGVTIVPEDEWDNGTWHTVARFYIIVNEMPKSAIPPKKKGKK